ncbi:MAG: putative RNA methyltransferase [Egibacteraceae bacterium]
MESRCVQFLRCPVCQRQMQLQGKSIICARTHTFDVARRGYLNLLRNKPGSDVLGDTREMLEARRRFLDAGHFRPLANAISDSATAHLATGSGSRYVLDSGCGEGYYLAQLADALSLALPGHRFCYFGVDVSKAAARLASVRYHDLNFVVCDVRSTVPLASGAARLILNVLAPRNVGEFARLAASWGLLVVVIPALDHLAELRERYELRGLGIRAEKEAQIVTELSTTFELRQRQNVRFQLHLSP